MPNQEGSRGDVTLAWAKEVLLDAGVASPMYDAKELLAYVLGTTRLSLPLVTTLTAEQEAEFVRLVHRRAAREPLQHLLGSAAFRTLCLAVGPGVFVPRPETEVVAGWAIERLHSQAAPVVVDLCTGSGAIALAIAAEVPHAQVHAVELDPAAHDWAAHNLAGSGVRLELDDATTALPELDGRVDAVTANPPYIPLDAAESVQPEVRNHDPSMALWSGNDGLDLIRAIAHAAARLLRPGGFLVCEHADAQHDSAPAIFAATGDWCQVRDHTDLADRPRFVTATRV